MTLRIAVILGSRNGLAGTTGTLVSQVLERLDPSTEVTVVTTDSLQLGPSCEACLRCMTEGESACPRFDGAQPALAAMEAADLVVFATPVHSFHVSASMKRFVDHFAYLIHRPRFHGTPAVLVSTAAGAGHDAALGYLRTAVRRWGFHTVAQLGVNGPGLAGAPYRSKVDAALDDLAAVITEQARTPVEPRPSTADLIGFRVARLLVQSSRAEGPVDAEYWTERGWFEAEWFTATRPPRLANTVAGLVERRIRRGIERGSASPYRG